MTIQTNPPVVGVIGDSLSAEYRDANLYGCLARSMTSVANGTFLAVDLAKPNMTAQDVRYNTGAWDQGAPFADVAGAIPVKYYVFRLGGVEAISRTSDLSGYLHDLSLVKENLRHLITATRAVGRKPVLCSYPTMPLSPDQTKPNAYTTATLHRIDLVHAYMGDLAAEENVPVLDLRSVVVTAAELHDNIHYAEVAFHRASKEAGNQFRNLITWY